MKSSVHKIFFSYGQNLALRACAWKSGVLIFEPLGHFGSCRLLLYISLNQSRTV